MQRVPLESQWESHSDPKVRLVQRFRRNGRRWLGRNFVWSLQDGGARHDAPFAARDGDSRQI